MCAQRSNGSLRGAVRRQSSSRASWLQVGTILDARQHVGSSRLDNAPAVVPKSLAKFLCGGGDRVAKAHGGVGVGVEGARGGGLREERRCCGALAQRRLCVATHPAHQQQGLVEGGSLREGGLKQEGSETAPASNFNVNREIRRRIQGRWCSRHVLRKVGTAYACSRTCTATVQVAKPCLSQCAQALQELAACGARWAPPGGHVHGWTPWRQRLRRWSWF